MTSEKRNIFDKNSKILDFEREITRAKPIFILKNHSKNHKIFSDVTLN